MTNQREKRALKCSRDQNKNFDSLASNLEGYFSISTLPDECKLEFFTNPADKERHKFENDSIAVPIHIVYSIFNQNVSLSALSQRFHSSHNRLFVFAFGLAWT